MKPAAMAAIAGMLPWHARCLREKRARKRRARGSDSEVSAFRSVMMVISSAEAGSVAEGVMVFLCCVVNVFVNSQT